MNQQAKHLYEFGPFRLDPTEHLLLRDGQPLALTPKAFETLVALVDNSGHVLEKNDLLKRVWPDAFVEEATLAQNVFTLRKVLGDSPEGHRYIETIPRHGYRFVASVRLLDEDTPASLAGTPEARAIAPPVARGRYAPVALLALAALVAAAAYFSWQRLTARNTRPPQKVLLAVLPFENLTGDPEQEYFSDGLTEEMITRLGGLDAERLGVIARTSAMQYKNTPKGVNQIGHELGVDYVLEGSVRRGDDRVRISAQLIQVRDQTHLWAESYERDRHDLLALESDVANAIARQIALKLPQYRAPLADNRPINPEAYELYLKGRYFWNKRTPSGLREGIEYFEQAIKIDPSSARAYAGLADSYILLGPNDVLPAKEVYPKAKGAALKALQIDDTLADAHASLGFVTLLYDWNRPEAEKEFRRAIELNPNYPTAHHWYAYDLAALGRMDEALREIHRARELDPLSLIINTDVGQMLFFARRYDEAIAQCQKAMDLDPSFNQVYWYLGLFYEQKGMYDQALEAFLKELMSSPGDPHSVAAIRAAYRASGMKAYWRRRLAILERQATQHYVSPYTLAVVYARIGDKDHALEELEKAYEERYPSMIFLEVEPVFDNLRSDPRFADLLRRVGLPPPNAAKP